MLVMVVCKKGKHDKIVGRLMVDEEQTRKKQQMKKKLFYYLPTKKNLPPGSYET